MAREAGQPGIGPEHDIGVEHGDQRVEVTLARGGDEGVDDLPLGAEVGVRERRGTADAAAGTARELPSRVGRALHDRRDLLERHREHVVQDERESLGGSEGLEHDQEREADRVGQQSLVLGVGAVGGIDDRVGHVHVERLLTPRLARSEHVQRDARDHCRQPCSEVLDLAPIGAAEPYPGILHGVVGLAERPEHPVGHRAQMRPLLLELLGKPFLLIHVTSLRVLVS